MGCVSRNQVIIDREEEYIGQLIGMLVVVTMAGYIEEDVMVQVEIIYPSSTVASICFFQQRDVSNNQLDRQWPF